MKPRMPLRYSITFIATIFCAFSCQQSLIAGGLPDGEAITGINWAWQQTRMNQGSEVVPNDPSRHTITFNSDGTLNIQADCNWGGGTYKTKENVLEVEITHTTQANCPPGSLEQLFIQQLNASESYYFVENDLFVELKDRAGTMEFGH